ncbi:MAG: hypothetical protein WA705_30730 [Candidatus Ozemobacteraceae bacterium]
MNGRTKQWMTVIIGILVFVIVVPWIARAELAKEYMRNGESYILVGHSDVNVRGVYRLNNPAGEAGANPLGKLFDPGNSYGLSVNLAREVFTFTTKTDPTYTFDPSVKLRRLLKAPGGVVLYGAHCDTRKTYPAFGTTFNQAGQPLYSTAGPSYNETGGGSNISWAWSGTVKVVQTAPGAIRVQKTAVSCDSNCAYTNGYSDGYWVYYVNVDGSGYGDIPNGAWWQSRDRDPSNRPGNLIYWDQAFRKYTKYDLYHWTKTMGIWTAGNPIYAQYVGPADSVYDEIVKRARISACMNCCCVNGSNDYPFPSSPKYVSLALSPFGRTYLYSRTQNSGADGQVRKNGVAMNLGDTNVIGLPNNVTTQWIGVSTADAMTDYVYLLGTQVIKNWLAAYSISVPADFNINAVSVSDQWWLDGGIVVAYDKTNKKMYQFIRNDKGGANTCKSPPISRKLDPAVDDIKADGFGNTYFSRTTFTPADAAISWVNAYSFVYTGSGPLGKYGMVYYSQRVDKTVNMMELGGTAEIFVGKQKLGDNVWRQTFTVPSSVNWSLLTLASIPTTPGFKLQGTKTLYTSVAEPDRIHLGVINVATPPKVEKIDGRIGGIDIVGLGAVPNYSNWASTEVNQAIHEFCVENAPEWNGKINVNTPGKDKWKGDQNGNGFEGGFVSSVVNTSGNIKTSPDVLYSWKVYKIQDSFGNPVLPADQLIKNVSNTTAPNFKMYFVSGVYQIECSAKFRWYNYDLLQFGSTVASLPACLRPTGGGYETAVAAAVPGFLTSGNYPGLHEPIPANTAVMLLKVNRLNPIPTGGIVNIQKFVGGVWTNPKAVAGIPHYHVATQGEKLDWRVDGNTMLNLFNLPVINDSNKVGVVAWENPAQLDYSFSLTLPDNSAFSLSLPSRTTMNKDDTSIKFGLDFPTDPTVGTLTCNAYRDWFYMRNSYDLDGNYLGQEKVTDTVKYTGQVSVLVLDTKFPEIVSVNNITAMPVDPLYYGTTYGKITDVVSGYANPASFSIRVRDNNPFANMTNISPIPESQHNRKTKQVATFFFERGSGKSLLPATNPAVGSETRTFLYYTSPGPNATSFITKWNGSVRSWTSNALWCPDIAQVSPVWNNATTGVVLYRQPQKFVKETTYSEVVYVLKASDWAYFQENSGPDDTVLDYFKRLPVGFANNSLPEYNAAGQVGAAHKGLALMFQAQDSSGNVVPARKHLGNLWIKDTLGPVMTMNIRDFANSFSPETVPFNLSRYLDPVIRYDILPTTTEWTPQLSGDYPSMPSSLGFVVGIPKSLAAELVHSLGYHPPKGQEGMEFFLDLNPMDNIDVAGSPNEPLIKVVGPLGLYTEGSPPQINLDSKSTPNKLRLVLQRSGVYNVTLTCQDTALTYDGGPAPIKRTITFGIVVAPTRMEIRVIDKKSNSF